MEKLPKYIFITGGVVSSLGKGVAAASLGALLQSRGYSVRSRKFDPYLNIGAGLLSPLQHGEIYITDDGAETDLDLGYYERFLGIKLLRDDSVSGGRMYWEVLNAEQNGDYGTATVQTIPHITNKIKEHITAQADADFVISEIGGTVGDIEGQVFLEAIRQLANDIGRRNVMFVHLTLAPYLEKSDELKTKPTQMSTRQLLESGIQADMLIVRSQRMLDDAEREKIGLFCNLPADNIISGVYVDNIYNIPLNYEKQNVFSVMARHFGLENKAGDLSRFEKIEKYLDKAPGLAATTIAMVGKYFENADSYKSLNDALFHAGIQNNVRVNIKKIDANKFDARELNGAHAIIVADIDAEPVSGGEVEAARYARENKIPFLGLGAGMQAAASEFKFICGAPSLGAKPIVLKSGSLAEKIYGAEKISERHRNNCELSAEFENTLNKNGMQVSGKSPDGKTVEIIEIKEHPFFIAAAFHPEFQSSPFSGHPLFSAFIAQARCDTF